MTQPSNDLRDMGFTHGPVKELCHVALDQRVQTVLDQWRNSKTFRNCKSIHVKGMLVGDLAINFYAKPNFTDKVEIYYPEPSSIPGGVDGFTRHHKGVFQENSSKIEVWTLTPESLHIPEPIPTIINEAGWNVYLRQLSEHKKQEMAALLKLRLDLPVKSAHDIHVGLMVASLECMIVLKLYASDNRRFESLALNDIDRMLENNPQITIASFDGWSLSEFHLNKLNASICRTAHLIST